MARYYGNIWGNRGEATRMGTRASGFQASARSYNGSVTVYLHEAPDTVETYTDRNGKEGKRSIENDWVNITVATGSDVGGREVYRGDMRTLAKAVAKGACFALLSDPEPVIEFPDYPLTHEDPPSEGQVRHHMLRAFADTGAGKSLGTVLYPCNYRDGTHDWRVAVPPETREAFLLALRAYLGRKVEGVVSDLGGKMLTATTNVDSID
jgi:hypothetical protein